MFADMGDSLIHISHHFDVQIQRQILVVILLRFHRLDLRRAVLQRGRAEGAACRVTPLSAICLLNAGRKVSAMLRCTSSVSTVLQVLGRWVLALTMIFSAGGSRRFHQRKYGTRQSHR